MLRLAYLEREALVLLLGRCSAVSGQVALDLVALVDLQALGLVSLDLIFLDVHVLAGLIAEVREGLGNADSDILTDQFVLSRNRDVTGHNLMVDGGFLGGLLSGNIDPTVLILPS